MSSAELYRERRKAGLCGECGCTLDNVYVLCDSCRKKKNERRKKLQDEYKKIGICRCGRQLFGDEKTCIDCKLYSANYKAKKRATMTDAEKEEERLKDLIYKKNQTDKLKANGLCVVCRKPTNNGKTKCNICNARFNEYQAKRKERLGLHKEPIQSRIDRKVCIYCLKPVYKDFKLCKDCYDKACTNKGMNSNHIWRGYNNADFSFKQNYS